MWRSVTNRIWLDSLFLEGIFPVFRNFVLNSWTLLGKPILIFVLIFCSLVLFMFWLICEKILGREIANMANSQGSLCNHFVAFTFQFYLLLLCSCSGLGSKHRLLKCHKYFYSQICFPYINGKWKVDKHKNH